MLTSDAGLLEVVELEAWLDAECPCEIPHKASLCKGKVWGILQDAFHSEYWGLKACIGLVEYRAKGLAAEPNVNCANCGNKAADCWRIIPI